MQPSQHVGRDLPVGARLAGEPAEVGGAAEEDVLDDGHPGRTAAVHRGRTVRITHDAEESRMAAMKPRTGDGPLEVTKEGRGIVMRVPLEGGGRLVVELNAEEAGALGSALEEVVG